MQIFYKQSVNIKTGGWSAPMKTKENIRQGMKNVSWSRLKKSSMDIFKKIPFAINKIERWHKRKGYDVVRSVRVNGRYRTVYLMVTKS